MAYSFSTARANPASPEHDQMVLHTARALTRAGWDDVRADLRDWPRPDLVPGYHSSRRPDVTGWDSLGRFHLFEIEIARQLETRETRAQLADFVAYAREYEACFWLVVPHGFERDATRVLRSLGAGRSFSVVQGV